MSVIALALFVLVTVALGGAMALALHLARPGIAALKAKVDHCPDRLEMRYTIVETVVRWNDGTVVSFPVRPAVGLPGQLRAAA